MIKALRYIAIILVCFIVLFFGYYIYNKKIEKIEKQQYIDLTRTTIVTQLETLHNLETASMTMQKTVEGKKGLKDLLPTKTWDNIVQNFLFEDTLEMTVVAKIVAGFNLSSINTGSVIVNDDSTVSLTLPKAEILRLNLTSDTKPIFRRRGVLNQGDMQMETEVRNQAIEKMKQEAIEKGLLDNAEKNATEVFKGILQPFGVQLREVVIQ